MPFSEHVYCVVITLKMTEWVEQSICIIFCIKLEHSSLETIGMIQKAAAIGNWWLATSSGQSACSCITLCSEFFWYNIKPLVWPSPLPPRFGALQLLAFPKTKITFEREEISDCRWLRKIQWCSWRWLGELHEIPSTYFEGDWGGIVLCTIFLVSCVFFHKCLYFS